MLRYFRLDIFLYTAKWLLWLNFQFAQYFGLWPKIIIIISLNHHLFSKLYNVNLSYFTKWFGFLYCFSNLTDHSKNFTKGFTHSLAHLYTGGYHTRCPLLIKSNIHSQSRTSGLSGAIWGLVSCPRTHQHVEYGGQKSHRPSYSVDKHCAFEPQPYQDFISPYLIKTYSKTGQEAKQYEQISNCFLKQMAALRQLDSLILFPYSNQRSEN